MSGFKKHKLKKTAYGIVGLAVIPIYSFLLSLKGPYDDLFERLIIVTFSQIGSRYGAIEDLIVWGLMTSFYCYSLLDYLIYLSGNKNGLLKLIAAFSCLSILFIVFLPFAPTMFPIVSETHNTLSYVAGFAILVTLFIFNLSFWNRDRKLFYKSFFALMAVVSLLLAMFFAVGVSSLFQITLASLICSYMFLELLFLEKSEKIDIFRKFRKDEEEDLF